MYPGWMIVGTQDPVGNPGAFQEIVNNGRAYAYAEAAGICWLEQCDACDAATIVTPGYPFQSVIADPAPWYDENDPDSWGFLGVIGLDVSGDDSSTRETTVNMSTSGVGVIGPTYMGPRTLVVRAMAIAEDECSLQFGLTWLRSQYRAMQDPCGGDTLTFFDCCPCVCSDDTPGGPCWAETYRHLRTEPPCIGSDAWWAFTYEEEIAGPPDPTMWWATTYAEEIAGHVDADWWPTTYQEEISGPSSTYWPNTYGELIVGPPEQSDEWCLWVETYRDLRMGPPQWTCCVEACVTPYLRQFYNVRVTEGPNKLSHPDLYSRGAVAEIEFTVVCADPIIHAMTTRTAVAWVDGGQPVVDAAPRQEPPNPYRQARPVIPRGPQTPEPAPLAASWVRTEVPLARVADQVLPEMDPRVRIRPRSETTGPLRVGVWAGSERIGGYTVPFVAKGTSLVLNGDEAYALVNGSYERLPTFVRDWDGRWAKPLHLPWGQYRLTVDQDATRPVKLLVDVGATPRGAG